MRPHIQTVSRSTEAFVICYPNAGQRMAVDIHIFEREREREEREKEEREKERERGGRE